jgi:hypothetical protein
MKYISVDPEYFLCHKKLHLRYVAKCWKTSDDVYYILYDEIKGYKHLRIGRFDDKRIHSFNDMQEIKNDLFGENVIAIEVYPRQQDYVNGTANVYHIWTWDGISVPNLKELYNYD